MRATDIGIVKPAKAVLVASGGAPPTGPARQGGGHQGLHRGRDRLRARQQHGPRRTTCSTTSTSSRPRSTPRTPCRSYLPFGSADDKIGGAPAGGVDAQFSGGHTTSWTYQGGKYVNQNSHAAQGDKFRPDTVLVLRVKVGDAGYLDPAGNPVPETKFTGTGKALMFHDGRVVKGTWAKSLDSTIKLRTKSGGALKVPAGHTWIELVPKDGGRVFIKK